MPRQRASQARAAFARVGAAPAGKLPVSSRVGEDAIISASGNTGDSAIIEDDMTAISHESDNASAAASGAVSTPAGRKPGKKAGKRRRRVGRPRGPERTPLTVRILTATDERLTAAVEGTGKNPQYLVDEALSEYLTRLGY